MATGASFSLAVGEALELSPHREGDAGALFAHLADGRVGRTIPSLPHPYLREHAESFVAARIADREALPLPEQLAIRLRASGELIGAVGADPLVLGALTDQAETRELGYWVAPEHQGRGVMRECLRAFLSYADLDLGLSRIRARALETNTASLALLVSNAFERRPELDHEVPTRDGPGVARVFERGSPGGG